MSSRRESYANDEDILLCQVYMQISQDPIIGTYQSANRFWKRVEDAFNGDKDPTWPERTQRSLQARIQSIEKAAKKFHGCIRAAEARNQSGASNADIMKEAERMLKTDSNYKSGWKFSHVRKIIKNFEKFQDCAGSSRQPSRGIQSSDSETQAHTSQASPALSSFPMSCDDDDEHVFGGSSSSRPIGVKKAKLKKKQSEDTTSLIAAIKKQNERLDEDMQKTNAQLDLLLANQRVSNELKQMKEENKILSMNVSSIDDPQVRAYFEAEKRRILQKRAQQQDQPNDDAARTYSSYFNNIGGSGSDLQDY